MWCNVKGFWKSKTFWLNLAALITVVTGMVPENYQVIAQAALALVNIGLRFTSEDKVTLTGK